jgi:Flp pilus assembly protein TadG
VTPPQDRGGASVELALLTPLLILLALLVVLGYRVTAADSTAEAAAHAAARAATLERTPDAARQAAVQATADAVRTQRMSCATHQLTLEVAGFEPGEPVTATVTCTAALADITGIAMP